MVNGEQRLSAAALAGGTGSVVVSWLPRAKLGCWQLPAEVEDSSLSG